MRQPRKRRRRHRRDNLQWRPPAREAFRRDEWTVIARHRTPRQVQRFLHGLKYDEGEKPDRIRSFRGVVTHGEVHCLEAALTAAAILEQHGYPPLLLDLESQDNLDHVLFLFRQDGRYGTVARSREAGLNGRKPVFRTIRQLVESYVDPYIDGTGRVTGYGLFDLRTLRRANWRLSKRNLWAVERALIHLPHKRVRTLERHYRRMLRAYEAFTDKYPKRPVTFYANRHLWM
ncbi:MAG: hypothetical protein ACE5HB_02165 [Terriglobia bacterium]